MNETQRKLLNKRNSNGKKWKKSVRILYGENLLRKIGASEAYQIVIKLYLIIFPKIYFSLKKDGGKS